MALVTPSFGFNSSLATLSDTMSDMDANCSRKDALNVFRMQVHPRAVDSAGSDPVVLFRYNGTPSIDPGFSITIIGEYTDPNQQAVRVSGFDMIDPVGVSGFDYMFNTNPDGSTKWIFVQLSAFNGFAVVDFATRKEIRRIQNPDLPPGKATVPQGSDPSHGMAVTADGKTLVVCSRLNNYLYSYSLPDLKPLGGAELSGKGAGWVTLTPDGKTAYVANPVTNDVSVVDVATMKETTRIKVGYVPKRNVTVALQ